MGGTWNLWMVWDAPSRVPGERRVPRKITPARLERIALAYLERYASSTENLRRVLMRRVKRAAAHHGSDPEDGAAMVDDLLRRYQETGLLDDDAYARMRTTSLHRRGASKRLIRAQLASKGVDSAIIGKALEALDGEHTNADLAAACRYARRRRLGPWRVRDRDDNRERDLAALARQGFSYDVARRVIESENRETLEELLETDDWL